MSARPGIAALIAAGETNASIVRATGRSLRRVQAVRRELRERELNGLPRALALEEVPTRTVLLRRPWTEQEQARHRAELLAALRGTA